MKIRITLVVIWLFVLGVECLGDETVDPLTVESQFTINHAVPLCISDSGDLVAVTKPIGEGRSLVSNSIEVWNIAGQDLLVTLPIGPNRTIESKNHVRIGSCAFDRAAATLAVNVRDSADKHWLEWWNVNPPALIARLEIDFRPLAVSFSPDGNYLAAGGKWLKIWQFSNRKPRLHIDLRQAENGSESRGIGLSCMAFSPDSKHLAFDGSLNTVTIVDIEQGEIDAGFLKDPHDSVRRTHSVAFSADGRVLIWGTYYGRGTGFQRWFSNYFVVHDLNHRDHFHVPPGVKHDFRQRRRAYTSSHALHLATIEAPFSRENWEPKSESDQTVVHVYDMANCRELGKVEHDPTLIAFTADRKHLLTASSDGLITKWHIPELPPANAARWQLIEPIAPKQSIKPRVQEANSDAKIEAILLFRIMGEIVGKVVALGNMAAEQTARDSSKALVRIALP